jgi:hypothetical protein
MKVVVCETRYPDIAGENLEDVPNLAFQLAVNPIYIGVKDQQVERMKKTINQEKLGGSSVGFWEVITRKGKVNLEKLREHDVVFIAAPTRAHESFRDKYAELVDFIVANA